MSNSRELAITRSRRAYIRPKFARAVIAHTHNVRWAICGHQIFRYVFDMGTQGDGNCYCRRLDPVQLRLNDKERIVRYLSQRTIHGRCPACNEHAGMLLQQLQMEEERENETAISARAAANAGDFGWEDLTEDWVPVEQEDKNIDD
ncbi:uncharacterized protein DFL_000278 [Arthrobotrys flagrans]|uniref:Uncharacterized protein n=1 Tax=Arthrobotrys flagrans TaxID=97331 RepID=A0A437ADF0_ARTFL|nr:hypothetical protein DFL_000278 [Arthrobotrys flagrans]